MINNFVQFCLKLIGRAMYKTMDIFTGFCITPNVIDTYYVSSTKEIIINALEKISCIIIDSTPLESIIDFIKKSAPETMGERIRNILSFLEAVLINWGPENFGNLFVCHGNDNYRQSPLMWYVKMFINAETISMAADPIAIKRIIMMNNIFIAGEYSFAAKTAISNLIPGIVELTESDNLVLRRIYAEEYYADQFDPLAVCEIENTLMTPVQIRYDKFKQYISELILVACDNYFERDDFYFFLLCAYTKSFEHSQYMSLRMKRMIRVAYKKLSRGQTFMNLLMIPIGLRALYFEYGKLPDIDEEYFNVPNDKVEDKPLYNAAMKAINDYDAVKDDIALREQWKEKYENLYLMMDPKVTWVVSQNMYYRFCEYVYEPADSEQFVTKNHFSNTNKLSEINYKPAQFHKDTFIAGQTLASLKSAITDYLRVQKDLLGLIKWHEYYQSLFINLYPFATEIPDADTMYAIFCSDYGPGIEEIEQIISTEQQVFNNKDELNEDIDKDDTMNFECLDLNTESDDSDMDMSDVDQYDIVEVESDYEYEDDPNDPDYDPENSSVDGDDEEDEYSPIRRPRTPLEDQLD